MSGQVENKRRKRVLSEARGVPDAFLTLPLALAYTMGTLEEA
jgi:hypothetical protein